MRRRDITPIVDLCHFGVPDWIGNFQNPDFPRLFADYAAVFAERYPWVQLYTPVNEMFICAVFSAKYGWWNEQLRSDLGFVTALKHIVKANVLAMLAILKRRAEAKELDPELLDRVEIVAPMFVESADLHLVDPRLAVIDGRDAVFDPCREHEVSDGLSPDGFGPLPLSPRTALAQVRASPFPVKRVRPRKVASRANLPRSLDLPKSRKGDRASGRQSSSSWGAAPAYQSL